MKEFTIRFRASDDELAIVKALMKKLGLSASSVLRLALRRLAEIEGVKKK